MLIIDDKVRALKAIDVGEAFCDDKRDLFIKTNRAYNENITVVNLESGEVKEMNKNDVVFHVYTKIRLDDDNG